MIELYLRLKGLSLTIRQDNAVNRLQRLELRLSRILISTIS